MNQFSQNFWNETNVLVTGGASFIGSHLVDKLVSLGSKVTVVDNLSSGTLENLDQSKEKITFLNQDLEYISKSDLDKVFRDQEIVFHLAAVHGGRGYITTHPADVSSNYSIDHHVFEGCNDSNVKNLVFASTACVYPTKLQDTIGSDYKLKEQDADPTDLDKLMSADIEYGWEKLMSEMQLNAFKKQYGLKGCPVRFVTAYGPRENETHAIIALIYKAIEKMNPYQIWGDGNQERDFTYVEDIVDGTILAAEKISDGTPVNLGTGDRYKMIDVVNMIFKILNWKPDKLEFDTSKPVGALSRALDNERANNLLGWSPKFNLEDGLRKTIDWYKTSHKIEGNVDQDILLERK
ncbi:NAD-dependent epimerase/dehydratase family protein [Candidatus Nitrosopelagicus sp.]|nr:NAD-dependent epimerase/dehydratase family protein [Candidatus Nitrosopelagicus sp.]